MVDKDAKRSIRLEIEGEIDSWSGYRYEAWEEDGHRFQRTKFFITSQIPSEPGTVMDIEAGTFERIWETMIETSKDKDSVGEPRYVMREMMLMNLDPTIWTLRAFKDGKEVMYFTTAGGPRTPIQETLCNLLMGLVPSEKNPN